MKQRLQLIVAGILVLPLLFAMGSGRSMLHYCNTLQKGELFFAFGLSQPHCDHQHAQPVVEALACCSLVAVHSELPSEEEQPDACCTFTPTDWSVVFNSSTFSWENPVDWPLPAQYAWFSPPITLGAALAGFTDPSPPPYSLQSFGKNNARLAFFGSFLI